MKITFFSKTLKPYDVDEMVDIGARLGLEGWDLAVRPGYAVNPDNVQTALPAATRKFGHRRPAGADGHRQFRRAVARRARRCVPF